MIRIQNLSKTFDAKNSSVHALKDINLEIDDGEIFGVIGLSGAGKSTLVRCMNLLEKPSSGEVWIDEENLLAMSEKRLRMKRREIGMIFQHFNLLMQRNVLDNVCFPMEIAGIKRRIAKEKAMEYLRIVGLEEKAKAYPVQLSGGQKQRVAIARTLASAPRIILCDEATSALDPKTTGIILSLLKRINKEYGITIVVITHELRVIEEICDRVAVLNHGKLEEVGTVSEVFDHPKSRATKSLLLNYKSELLREEEETEGTDNSDEIPETEGTGNSDRIPETEETGNSDEILKTDEDRPSGEIPQADKTGTVSEAKRGSE